MHLRSVVIDNLRVIHHTALQFCGERNIIIGENGSGKTSILEAIHMLGVGRSFRTIRAGLLVRHGETSLVVSGRGKEKNGREAVIGVEKNVDGTRIRVDGERIGNASVVARLLPVLVFDSESHSLLHGGPVRRRALLDRTLFHVEQHYLAAWKAYHRALKHRNVLARKGVELARVRYWNKELAVWASKLDVARSECVQALNEKLVYSEVGKELGHLVLQYDKGWSGADFETRLITGWDSDRKVGSTLAGPHRADVRIFVDSHRADVTLSRGQGKAVLTAILKAQADLIKERSGTTPVLLIDDLASELDDRLRALAVSSLLAVKGQIFFTAIKAALLPELEGVAMRMFHVERGAVHTA